MLEKIEKELDAYYDLFDEPFPLMQSSMDEDKIKSEIFECLKKKKKAPFEPYPKSWTKRRRSTVRSRSLFSFFISARLLPLLCSSPGFSSPASNGDNRNNNFRNNQNNNGNRNYQNNRDGA